MRNPRQYLCAFAVVLLSSLALASAKAQLTWQTHGAVDDFTITRDTTAAHSGRASIRFTAEESPSAFAGISTMVPGARYEGQRVRVSAQLRGAQLMGGGGVVWLRADGAGPAFTSTQQQPLLGTTQWTSVAVALDVPRGAKNVVLGVFSNGQGTLWIDDIRIETDSVPAVVSGFEEAAEFRAPTRRVVARSPREGPRDLSGRGLDNIIAFTRLLGYVRFFHPSSEAATVNWDDFAVTGMRMVEDAPGSDSLTAALRILFGPIAPNVAIYRTGDTPPPPPISPAPGAGVVYWQHLGIGSPSGGSAPATQNIYKSTRVLAPGAAVGAPMASPRGSYVPGMPSARIPDPARPLQLALGSGLSVSLPMAVFTTEPNLLETPQPRAKTQSFNVADRATRLASVALAWGVLQHFYPYHEIAHTDWPAALRSALSHAAIDKGDPEFAATMDRLIAALHDGHGSVSKSGSANTMPDVRLRFMEGKIVVVGVGDSASVTGLKAGDVVVSIDGRPADGALAAMSELVSGATPQWIRYVALTRMLVGPPAEPVTIRVSRPGVETKEVRVPRSNRAPLIQKPRDRIEQIFPGIFYVDLDRITDADFTVFLPKLAEAKGIVFDMRGYPRQVATPTILAHLTDTTIHSARFEIPLVTLPDHVGMTFTSGDWTIAPAAPRIRARVAFLTGGESISYAESTMGVVEEFGLGAIVGEPTAGTNGNVNPFVLPVGYTVSWTGMRVTKRNGTPHHGVGNIPTVPVSPTIAGIRAGRDEVLERAVQIVQAPSIVP